MPSSGLDGALERLVIRVASATTAKISPLVEDLHADNRRLRKYADEMAYALESSSMDPWAKMHVVEAYRARCGR